MSQIAVPGTGLLIFDLGPGLNAVFFDLIVKGSVDGARLRTEAFAYFDTHSNPDEFAFNFTVIGLPSAGATLAQLSVWDAAIDLMHEWEEVHPGNRLHKGGAYYFGAVRDIVLGDIDRGFLRMHEAVREDRVTYGPGPTAATAFVTLDDSFANQAFRTGPRSTAAASTCTCVSIGASDRAELSTRPDSEPERQLVMSSENHSSL